MVWRQLVVFVVRLLFLETPIPQIQLIKKKEIAYPLPAWICYHLFDQPLTAFIQN